MEAHEEQFNAGQSLQVIQAMIEAAKAGVRENGFAYLLWGWLVFVASIAQYVLLKMQSDANALPWLLMPVGGVVTMIYFMRKKHDGVKTYIDSFMGYLWTAFGVALGIVLVFQSSLGHENLFPMILMIYGIGTFVSGGALQFKPLIIGGVLCWVAAVSAFFAPVDVQLLLLAAGVAAGYIVPGHLLSAQVRRAEA